MDNLKKLLGRIDGRGYKAYKDVRGSYVFRDYRLFIDHVQGDPFAAVSRVRAVVDAAVARFPQETYRSRSRCTALEDFITRAFASAIRRHVRGRRGSGKSGIVSVDDPGQEILERTSCSVDNGAVEIRFGVGLPASGRRVLGREAEEMFFLEIPSLVKDSLLHSSHNHDTLMRHLHANEDQDALRDMLTERGLVAFIADGSILPRASGVDDRPLSGSGECPVIEFRSPDSMRLTVGLPNTGEVVGAAIPEGITLIVGGGFHGKSTVLRSLERGVYNHIPGDGRELVVTRGDAVKIRAEDGRSVAGVDISPFIDNLPFRSDTKSFSTDNASGSTSQAANIMEALEVGCRLLLIDEDTSATNFMIRDKRMQALVSKDKEPITPFLDRVRTLCSDMGVSTILVMGGSGDYFDEADKVIMMDEYVPKDVTAEAEKIVDGNRTGRVGEGEGGFDGLTERMPLQRSFDPRRGRRDVRIEARGLKTINYGTQIIDLSAVEQLVHRSQTRAIGDIIHYYAGLCSSGNISLRGGLLAVEKEIERSGLDILSGMKKGDYALPRIFEVAAAINRMRSLSVKKKNINT